MPLYKQPIELTVDLTDVETTLEALDTRLVSIEDNVTTLQLNGNSYDSAISTLQTSDATQDTNIADIDGRVSILEAQDINGRIAVLEASSSNNLVIPSNIKTVAADTDYFIGIDSNGMIYKISKANLLAGLSSGSNGGGSSGIDPYFSDVVFLSHLNSLVDVKGKTITAFGNAVINNADGKFTSASALFDGSGDYLQISSAADLNFSTGQDFTIECFVKFVTLPTSSTKTILARSVQSSDNTFNLDITPSNIRVTGWFTVYIDTPHGFSSGNWYYIAVTREGSSLKLFVDGVQKGTTYSGTTNFPNTNNFTIGGDPLSGASATINGRIVEVRITKRARVINSVPTTAFPDS